MTRAWPESRRRISVFLAVAAVCGAAARTADAQHLVGTVRSRADSVPVGGALIVVLDSAGRVVKRSVSSEQGAFVLLLPSGGRYVVRVLRIGQRPWEGGIVRVAASGRTSVVLYAEDQPIVLPEIRVESGWRCGAAPSAAAVALLLEEAHKALAITQSTLDEGRLAFTVERWRRRLTPTLQTIDSTGWMSLGSGWPIRAAAADTLRLRGFVFDEPTESGVPMPAYYGPDATVLFADWFLDTRCLRLRRGASDAGPYLTVEFTPGRRTPGVDIGGEFVFDSASLELRELRFHWVGLPTWVPPRGPGGEVTFTRHPSGAWLPQSWSYRAPVPERLTAGMRLREYLEIGGRVRRIR